VSLYVLNLQSKLITKYREIFSLSRYSMLSILFKIYTGVHDNLYSVFFNNVDPNSTEPKKYFGHRNFVFVSELFRRSNSRIPGNDDSCRNQTGVRLLQPNFGAPVSRVRLELLLPIPRKSASGFRRNGVGMFPVQNSGGRWGRKVSLKIRIRSYQEIFDVNLRHVKIQALSLVKKVT